MKQHPYEDILNCPRPEPMGRVRMSRIDRAAQFAPFAALTGYDQVIAETGRVTSRPVELEEQEKQRLDRYLNLLYRLGDEAPRVRITYFVPDSRKEGGAYAQTEGKVVRILPGEGLVRMENGDEFFFREIVKITFPEDGGLEEFV